MEEDVKKDDEQKSKTLNGLPVHKAWRLRRLFIILMQFYIAYLIHFYNGVKEPTEIQVTIIENLLALDMWILLLWLFAESIDNIADKLPQLPGRK